MEDAIEPCTKKVDDCKPRPIFCPSEDCISHSVEWEDTNFPNLLLTGVGVEQFTLTLMIQGGGKAILSGGVTLEKG